MLELWKTEGIFLAVLWKHLSLGIYVPVKDARFPAAPTEKKQAPAVKIWRWRMPTSEKKQSWSPETSTQIDVWHSLPYPWVAEVGQKLKRL